MTYEDADDVYNNEAVMIKQTKNINVKSKSCLDKKNLYKCMTFDEKREDIIAMFMMSFVIFMVLSKILKT